LLTPVLRGYTQTNYSAKSWKVERRVCARIEATELGLDIRYVVTNIANGSPEHIYDTLYCARGQMENLIKLHKSQLASDRTSCRAPLANQMRLILHTAAYWLILELRDAIPKTHPLAVAEFVTLREKLLKIGARIVETASRIKLALATACIPTPRRRLAACGTVNDGAETVSARPRSPIYPTPTRSKSADRPSGKDATRNCVRNHVAKKIASALQLGE